MILPFFFIDFLILLCFVTQYDDLFFKGYRLFLSQFLKIRHQDPFLSLMEWVEKAEENSGSKDPIKFSINYPEVQIYNQLWRKILRWSRLFGLNLGEYKKLIRKRIWEERKNFRRKREEVRGIYYQMIFTLLITFSLSLSFTVFSKRESFEDLYLIFFIGLLGMVLFKYRSQKLKRAVFWGYDTLSEGLYGMEILAKLNLSPDLLWKESKLREFNQKKFRDLMDRLKFLMEQYHLTGQPIVTELGEIIEEIYFLKEEDYESYLKRLKIMKIFYLSLFFIAPYFYFIFSFFRSSLTEGAMGF